MAKLGEMLVSEGAITKEQLEQALQAQKQDGGFLGAVIVKKGFVSEEHLVEILTRQTGIPSFNPATTKLDPSLGSLVPSTLAKQYGCVPVQVVGDMLQLAMMNPDDEAAIEAISRKANRPVKPLVIGPKALEGAWVAMYGPEAGAPDAKKKSGPAPGAQAAKKKTGVPKKKSTGLLSFGKLIDGVMSDVEVGEIQAEDLSVANLEGGADDPPIIRLVNAILLQGVKMGASDIHLEPFEKELRARFRIDGVLHQMLTLPATIKQSVTSRIKILANLDISEKRLPQDGRVKVILGDQKTLDFRVSCLPSIYGEKIVIRVLGVSSLPDNVDKVGFGPKALNDIRGALDNPYGMILVTGPTGSGKSTTLYTMLKQLNQPDVNIVTVEDPVEYNMMGITQVNVKPYIGFTFDMALRSFLRQDPDIIMVGEMRDFETAAIAVKAALTGHLVLSTLHTNDAPATVVRLIDMGIEPYLVASAVKVVIAQRLVRRICKHCIEETRIEDSIKQVLDESELELLPHVYAGKGCPACKNVGYKGRAPVFEVMPVRSKDLKRIITEGGTEIQVAQVARREGVVSLRGDVLRLVAEKVTTLEEASSILLSD
ncbi:MAG: ATPase, T2SS/T4P/T4SS family [Planctomycetota bacterium]|nr:ATPase, T2SS/T4P/T4SS family [Planctomycetota bacterium]